MGGGNVDKKLLIVSMIYTFQLYGMENDNSALIPKNLTPEIIKTASYFILHQHFKNEDCLRHAEPSCVGINFQKCLAQNNPSLRDYFKEDRKVLVFHNQDKQPLLENVHVYDQQEKTKSLLETATKMLDPNCKPRATYGVNSLGSMPPILNLFDKDNELIMCFFGFEEIKSPLSEEQKKDLSRFVQLDKNFIIKTPEPKGCCDVI